LRISKLEIYLLGTGFIILFLMLVIINPHLLYDEPAYLGNVSLLEKYGFGKAYLLQHNGSAGPLYTIVHYILKPFTQLQNPAVRFVNIFFILSITFITALCIKELKSSHWSYSLYVACVPFTFVIAGLALTECPAMFFFTLGIYLLIKIKNNITNTKISLFILLAALCFNLAIIGRQPYLLFLIAIPALYINKGRKGLLISFLVILLSLPLPIYVFYIWKGLVAPIDTAFYKGIADAGKTYSPEYVLLYINYILFILLLIAPSLFTLPGKKKQIGLFVVLLAGIGLNYIFQYSLYVPAQSVVEFFMNSYHLQVICPPVIFIITLLFIRTFYYNAIIFREKEVVFFLLSATTLIGLSCIKITYGFSSRYAAQSLPLLIIIGSYFYKPHWFNNVRIAVGIIISILSLITYYYS
jgi:hypothetical protein